MCLCFFGDDSGGGIITGLASFLTPAFIACGTRLLTDDSYVGVCCLLLSNQFFVATFCVVSGLLG